eukprot:CAMPEP_0176499746 /NCGR_PEP_ID=MMETSP0200_2-20121128/13112_1 /TAXON_ID=947934 /ORGANISM="Chaetoceros sp., Strain GSL56" /LENGTH=630 /DNA_ID=CAMNT_0017898227 /DNA_START=220 /DNA_END=2112 /DNA_ORIENTATION=-
MTTKRTNYCRGSLQVDDGPVPSDTQRSDGSKSNMELCALTKRQTAIYDGPEFVSIASVLKKQQEEASELLSDSQSLESDDDANDKANDNMSYQVPSMRSGFLTFVTGTIENGKNSNEKVLGIEIDEKTCSDKNSLLKIDKNVYIHKDSMVIIPKGISDHDAISTASASLAGVYCSVGPLPSSPPMDENKSTQQPKGIKKAVVLGGGDYACFIAKALDCLDVKVTMVTTRPMSLKDTPLNPLYRSNVVAMPPAVGKDEMGFSDALGDFDAVIDTLGDEANLQRVKYLDDGIERIFGEGDRGVAAKLRRVNRCQRYISTLTRSQEIVLKEGILFAREPVLKYQKDVEKVNEIFGSTVENKKLNKEEKKTENEEIDDDDNDDEEEEEEQERYTRLPIPMQYGQMIQKLLNSKVIFPTDRNENGSHKNKDVFVRGCSFPDYAEIEIWPTDSTDGATVRYGFPAIAELTLESKLDKMMGSAKKSSAKKRPREKTVQENPFVLEVESLLDVKEDIVNQKKDAVLFVSAPYCKLCRSINHQFTRMARISKEEKQSDLLFAKASSAGKEGKQLTFTLNIDSVPTFILFKKGQRYGEPFGVVKLPSKKLDTAIEYLLNDKEWDSSIIGMETNVRRTKLK